MRARPADAKPLVLFRGGKNNDMGIGRNGPGMELEYAEHYRRQGVVQNRQRRGIN